MQTDFAAPFNARLAIALVFVIGTTAGAQLPTISGGTRVRLAISEPAVTVQGTVFSQSADTVFLAGEGGVRPVPVHLISRISVGGERSHAAGAWRGAKIGALIIGGVGAVAFGTASETSDGRSSSSDLLAFVAASALSGAFYGAIIGGAVGAETWTPVYDSRVSMSIRTPRGGPPGIGLAFKF